MPTQPFLHQEMNGGMDATSQPHLLKPNQWRLQHNMRVVHTYLTQVPQKRQLLSIGDGPILALANVPSGYLDYGSIVGLTSAHAWRISGSVYRKMTFVDGSECSFVEPPSGGYVRFGTCSHNNRFFFVNPLNPARYTDGVSVYNMQRRQTVHELALEAKRLVPSDLNDVPAGKYCAVFFDHLVIGAPVHKGTAYPHRVMWSHLKDYSNFTPGTASEADSYTCTEHQSGDEVVEGVTGLQIWKEYCVIYTENAIYAMHYTGFPRIVNVRPMVLDYGNGLPYAIAALNDTHAFIDTKHENFFYLPNSMALSKPDAFGDPIKDFFFNDLNEDFELRSRTFAYKDKNAMEVVWVYVSQNSEGAFDKAVAFNWENNTWSVRDVEQVESFVHAGKRALCADELGEPANTQFATKRADETAETLEVFGRVWGNDTGQLLRESTSDDADELLYPVLPPLLETGDFMYGTLSTMKEVNRVLLNVSAEQFKGIKVEVAVRKFTGEKVEWQQVGLWTPELAQEMLTFATKSGKIIRYRFTGEPEHGKQVRGLIFTSFEEQVSGFAATK